MMNRTVALLLAASALVLPAVSAQAVTINFDALANNASANLDAAAQANGVSFLSGFMTEDLDGFGDPIPGEFHFEAYSDSDIRVVDPTQFGVGAAPSGSRTINTLWDQLLIRFDAPKMLTSFGFAEDGGTFGNPFPASILFLDENGKTLFESGPYQPNTNASHRYDFSFAAANVSQILLPSMSKLYDDISFTTAAAPVPEPASWALMIGGFALAGVAMRRRSMQVAFARA